MKTVTLFAALALAYTASAGAQDLSRWQRQANNVTIVRDDWGVAHVYGRTDADAVFGMIYAQAEDDFNRIETNYLTSLGRLSEADGDVRLWQDLRQRLFIDPDTLQALYQSSPAWLKKLMDAWADGLNYYLASHPFVHPRVLTHFEPWMALSFTEGSIGGDIEQVNLNMLQRFYDNAPGVNSSGSNNGAEAPDPLREPTGSNGFAVAPALNANHRAMLLINPHTSFFFRSELQMTSGEDLNAYGAVTWGQFFVYQGFNDRVGWMHTSSAVDNIDEWTETVVQRDGRWFYRYGTEDRPMLTSTVTLAYKTGNGLARRTFTVYRTHHGPIVRRPAEPGTTDKWVSVGLMNSPVSALIQSYSRTKARSLADYRQVLEMHTNSSNNTLFATADGDIAYFHSNFIPRRDTSFDWRRPVDGSNPATDWNGVLSFDETPNVVNPSSGWAYNSNDAPWHAAGPSSPRQADYPRYVDAGFESARGHHAVRVLEHAQNWTLDSLRAAAYDSYLPWFENTVPALVRAFDAAAATDPLKEKLREPIDSLRHWDFRWSVGSVPTSLAVFWGTEVSRRGFSAGREVRGPLADYVATQAPGPDLLSALSAAVDSLAGNFGSWKTAWGDINRFQRNNGDIVQQFNDSKPSIPVGFPSGNWGSLASFGARPYTGTRKWYGTSGNSFVAIVEFGQDSVRALAVTAGGESGHTDSRHFNDQARRYATGDLRPVYFYRNQLVGHTERAYHPGH